MSLSTAISTLAGVLIPFAGTTLGAACVFFLRGEMRPGIRKILTGFAAGVMVAASLLTIAASSLITGMLPCLLSFAAGAMMYVVVEELIPEMSEEPHSNLGPVAFAFGFVLMMILDVTLG